MASEVTRTEDAGPPPGWAMQLDRSHILRSVAGAVFCKACGGVLQGPRQGSALAARCRALDGFEVPNGSQYRLRRLLEGKNVFGDTWPDGRPGQAVVQVRSFPAEWLAQKAAQNEVGELRDESAAEPTHSQDGLSPSLQFAATPASFVPGSLLEVEEGTSSQIDAATHELINLQQEGFAVSWPCATRSSPTATRLRRLRRKSADATRSEMDPVLAVDSSRGSAGGNKAATPVTVSAGHGWSASSNANARTWNGSVPSTRSRNGAASVETSEVAPVTVPAGPLTVESSDAVVAVQDLLDLQREGLRVTWS